MKMTQRQVPSPGNANQYEGGRQIGFLRQAWQNLQKAYSKAKEEEEEKKPQGRRPEQAQVEAITVYKRVGSTVKLCAYVKPTEFF
jgi:hypothetical protein